MYSQTQERGLKCSCERNTCDSPRQWGIVCRCSTMDAIVYHRETRSVFVSLAEALEEQADEVVRAEGFS